jgi:3-ketodihydrosphingosine reductase
MWLIALLALLFFLIIFIVVTNLKRKTIEIKDKHVLITGASKGIGKELALLCFQMGSRVSLLARDKQCLEEAREYILSHSGPDANEDRIKIYSVDVAKDYLELCKAVQNLESSLGPVFVLFNLVGKATSLRFEDTPIEEFQSMINVNYLSTVNSIKAVLPTMMSRKEGLIEITSSIGGLLGIYGYTAYSASKFALLGLAESLAMEVK